MALLLARPNERATTTRYILQSLNLAYGYLHLFSGTNIFDFYWDYVDFKLKN